MNAKPARLRWSPPQVRIPVHFGLAALLGLVLAPRARAETVDAYTDAFPPHPELSVTHARVLWVGAYCDDPACPPGVPIAHETDTETQTNLGGVHGGQRLVTVWSEYGAGMVAQIDDASGTLHLTTTATLDQVSHIALDYSRMPEPPGMSLDLTQGGADALAFDVSGSGLDGSGLVGCTLSLASHHGEKATETAETGAEVTGPGQVLFPFVLYPSQVVDFRDIDFVSLLISVAGSVDLAIGPLHSTASATATVAKTWGAIKQHYR